MKSFNRQFREIKFPANTIFLRHREIKDSRNVPRKFSRNLSPAKIKENKVFTFYIVFDDLFLNRFSRHVLATTGDPSVVTGYKRV